MKKKNGPGFARVASMLSVLALALFVLNGCATAPAAPTVSLTDAREAIARAEQSDARQHAGSELDEAQRKLEMAQRAVAQGEMAEAELLAREAEVAAKLASARADSAKAAEVNREMRRGVDALTEEMRRRGEPQ